MVRTLGRVYDQQISEEQLLTGLSVGQAKLSDYSHRNRPWNFCQPQLFACLVYKTSHGLDYRCLQGRLDDTPELCQ